MCFIFFATIFGIYKNVGLYADQAVHCEIFFCLFAIVLRSY